MCNNEDNEDNEWSNYETWICDLWLSNDEALTSAFSKMIAGTSDPLYIAKRLQDFISESAPNIGGIHNDLMRAAMENIDFREIAEVALEEAEIEIEML